MEAKPVMLGKLAKGVVDALLARMDSGDPSPGGYLGTENELARQYGVSRTTARLALRYLQERGRVERGEGQGVKGFLAAGPGAGVDAVAASLAALANGTNGTVGPAMPGRAGLPVGDKPELLFLRAGDNLFVNEMFTGAAASPWAAGFRITLLDGTGPHGNYVDLLANLPPRYGHLLLPPLDFPEVGAALEQLVARGVRVVQLDRYLAGLRAPAVMSDHFAIGVEATRHLLETLDRPVYYLGNFRQPTSAALRFEGWKAAMHRHGYDDWMRYVIGYETFIREESDYTVEETIERELTSFLSRREFMDEPLPVFCISDQAALRVYRLCERLGVSVAERLRLTAAGGMPFSVRVEPPLTTMVIDWRAIGAEAIRLLAEGREEFVCAGWRKLLPAKLAVRASSSPTPADVLSGAVV